jgi:hypothetical protein
MARASEKEKKAEGKRLQGRGFFRREDLQRDFPEYPDRILRGKFGPPPSKKLPDSMLRIDKEGRVVGARLKDGGRIGDVRDNPNRGKTY